MFSMLIPSYSTSSTEMGPVSRVPDSRQFSGMNHVGLLRWSINPGSKSFFRSLRPFKLPPHVFRSFHYSIPPDHKTWSHLSHKMNVNSYVSRNKVLSQKMTGGSSSEALRTRAIKFCKSLTVLAVVLSTVFVAAPARAGVESTLQTKFSGLVDASTSKVSSVEAILAKQLARRFREMSDEELILVLQELLKASRSSMSPEDLLLDGNSRKDFLSKDGSKEDNRKSVGDEPTIKDPVRRMKQGREARNGGPDLSAPSSKLADSVTKNTKEDNYKPDDGIDRAAESRGGGEAKSGGLEMSVPGLKFPDQALKGEKLVLPGKGRAPVLGRETVSEDALTRKKSRSPASAREQGDEAEQPSERIDKVGESESQDMTGILWDEWRRRFEGQTILEPTNNEESSLVSSTTNVWRKMQKSSMSILKRASDFSSWMSNNRDAVGGGVLGTGSIICVLFIGKKILALSPVKGSKNEDPRVDPPHKITQPPATKLKNSGQYIWNFLQTVPTSFKAAQNRLLGSEEGSAQVGKASSRSTTSSNSIDGSTTAVPYEVPLNVASGPATRSTKDDMLPKRSGDREKSTETIQNLSLLSPSGQLQDRFVKRTGDRQGDPEIGDAIYGSGLDDVRTFQSSDLQESKNGKEDDVGYKNSQFPPSTSATVNDGRKSLEFPAQEANIRRYLADEQRSSATRGSPLTSNTKGERGSAAMSFRGSVQGMTVGKKTGAEPRQKVELSTSEKRRAVREVDSFQSNVLQKDSNYQTRRTDFKDDFVSGSTNKVSSRPSSRPTQLDPLAYRRKEPDREPGRVELEDRFSSASVDSRQRVSTKSTSFLSGSRRRRNDGEKGGPSFMEGARVEEVPSDTVGYEGPPESRKIVSPNNGGLHGLEQHGLGTEPRKKFTEKILRSITGKKDPIRDDALTNNTSILVRDPDQFIVRSDAEHAKYAAVRHGDNARGAARFMDIRRGLDVEKVGGQSSDIDGPCSVVEPTRGEHVSRGISSETPDTVLEVLSKSIRKSSEVGEDEVAHGKAADSPVSNDLSATQLPQEKVHDEGMIYSVTSRQSWLGSEVREDEDSAQASASSTDAGDTGRNMQRDGVWNNSATPAFEAVELKHPYSGATQDKSDDSGASWSAGREFESQRVAESRPELDSFFHNQNFWVRDSDGVFIKQAMEGQGMVLQERAGSRVPGFVRALNEAVGVSTARRRALTTLNRGSNPAGTARLQKQRRSISSGFDYRQLYLTPNDDNRTLGEQYESKASVSKKYTPFPSSSDTGKTRPIRYGVERTR